MEQSKINKKLLAFQKQNIEILKNKLNTHFRSKYADLDEIMKCIRPGLNANGLIISTSTQIKEGFNLSITKIIDAESGEFIESHFPIYENQPQKLGLSLTYARRYSIASLLNLVADDDDDGAISIKRKEEKTKEQKKQYAKIKNEITDAVNLMQDVETANLCLRQLIYGEITHIEDTEKIARDAIWNKAKELGLEFNSNKKEFNNKDNKAL